ncbi:MAG: lysophospholipid acyltransferase family protein [Gemmatimonadales bacterium]
MRPPPPLDALTPFERFAVRLVGRMQRGAWQRFWFWGERQIGARWIEAALGPLLEVHGLDHVSATTRDRPVILIANHRSFFDLYVAMSTLFRRLPGWRSTCFPVRGRYYYQTVGGLLLNGIAAWWSMYPPFFHEPRCRRFDQWALTHLGDLAREGPGRLIGFHPEGTRNKGTDPYSFLPTQPGIGRLMHEARPQVVPAFIAGLGNNLPEIVSRRWRGGERVRLWFGPPVDYAHLVDLPPDRSTHRVLADLAMSKVADLAVLDRAAQSLNRDLSRP